VASDLCCSGCHFEEVCSTAYGDVSIRNKIHGDGRGGRVYKVVIVVEAGVGQNCNISPDSERVAALEPRLEIDPCRTLQHRLVSPFWSSIRIPRHTLDI
jgi:hypothetical protein